MTSSVERKENDSDDDMYGMLEIYEHCEYILWIINEKTTARTKNKKQRDTHTLRKIVDKNYSNTNYKK